MKYISNRIHFFLVLFVVMATDTVIFATNNDRRLQLLSSIILALLVMLFFILHFSRFKVLIKNDLYVLFVFLSIIVSMLLSGRLLNGYFYIFQIMCFAFGWLFSYKMSAESFADKYVVIMRTIAIVSLLGFFFTSAFMRIDLIPTITNTAGLEFKSFMLINIPLLSNLQRRIWGPFWEPGVFQAYLNMAFYFTLFYGKKYKLFDMVLFSITSLLTLSGAAFLPIMFFSFAYIVSNNTHKANKCVLVVLIISLIAFVLQSAIFDEMIFKFAGGVESHSFAFRYASIVVNIKEFLMNPLFGSTPENLDAARSIFMYNLVGSSYLSNTNTYFAVFAYFGLYVGIFYTINIWRFFYYRIKHKGASLLAVIGLIATTSNENLMASLFICTVIFLVPEKVRLDRVINKSKNYYENMIINCKVGEKK